jgi:hypothetical protein
MKATKTSSHYKRLQAARASQAKWNDECQEKREANPAKWNEVIKDYYKK